MNKKIALSTPHLEGNELEYIQDAFKKNWVTTLGENIDFFEKQLQTYLGEEKFVTAVNSCTSAIHLSLILLGVKGGDEVIAQSLTFAGSSFPILYQNATPIFVDSEITTWNMCPNFLEDAIKDRLKKGKKPKAILPVHLYGMPYQVDEIHSISKHYEIPVIEDAAEALGSHYKNKKCGTFGDYGTISFNGNKIITTSGGGIVISNNEESKKEAIHLATQARDQTDYYQHSKIGFNYRMSNLLAGLGRSQMHVLDARISKRRENQKFYRELFQEVDGVTVHNEPNTDYFSNHWLSAIIIDPKIAGKTREDLRLSFLEDTIESRPLWKPMHLQPVFANAPYYGGKVAEELFDNGLCLPSGSNLTDSERERIAKKVKEVFA